MKVFSKYHSLIPIESDINWHDQRCALITIQDVTEFKLTDEKNLVDGVKQQIFNTFTHELLTPLNGMICAESIMQHELNKGSGCNLKMI